MEQLEIEIQKATKKIYSKRLICGGTLLGGPLVTGYLMAENFKAFNEPEKVKRTWVYAILATLIIFGGIVLTIDRINIPNQLIPLINYIIAYFIVQHYQGEEIKTHVDNGGHYYKWGRVLLIGLIGTVCLVILILLGTLIYALL